MKLARKIIAVAGAALCCLAIVGCSSSSTATSTTVFGHEGEGYITANQAYDFDFCLSGLYGWKAADAKSFVGMTDIGSTYAEYMADDDGNIDEDELSETFQEILDYAVESYEDDGCTTEDYTTDSGVSGKLIKATDSDVVDTVAQDFPLTDVEIDNPVYYIFATSDLKIVYIYADQETADALITTYSLEGTPTTELTDEMIEQMEEDTYNEYIAPYYETDDEDSDDTITDDEDSSIIIEDGDDDSTTDESSDNETQESDDTIVITDDETTSSVVE